MMVWNLCVYAVTALVLRRWHSCSRVFLTAFRGSNCKVDATVNESHRLIAFSSPISTAVQKFYHQTIVGPRRYETAIGIFRFSATSFASKYIFIENNHI